MRTGAAHPGALFAGKATNGRSDKAVKGGAGEA